MRSNLAFNFAPAVSGEKRLDVAFENGETVIRMSTYVEGLGWSTQKTLSLDEAALDDLHRIVSAARTKIKQANAVTKEAAPQSSNVLKFPQFA